MIEPGFADHVDGGHYILPVPVEFAHLYSEPEPVPRETPPAKGFQMEHAP